MEAVVDRHPVLRRRHDWPQRLHAAITARRAWVHAWGPFNCAFAVADLIEAITDVDLAAPFRGTFSDQAGAEAVMAANGWADLAALCDAFLPRTERPLRGDVVLIPGAQGAFLAVMWERGRAAAFGARGYVLAPTGDYLAAWKVG